MKSEIGSAISDMNSSGDNCEKELTNSQADVIFPDIKSDSLQQTASIEIAATMPEEV